MTWLKRCTRKDRIPAPIPCDFKVRLPSLTEASSGIGKAIAKLFAAESATLVLAACSADNLEALAHGLRATGQTSVVPTGVRREEEVVRLVARAMERFGGVDILVNSAGIGLCAHYEQVVWNIFERCGRSISWRGRCRQ